VITLNDHYICVDFFLHVKCKKQKTTKTILGDIMAGQGIGSSLSTFYRVKKERE
jgi:hypothetical protein